jgi:DNA-binding NtrC family response regulator
MIDVLYIEDDLGLGALLRNQFAQVDMSMDIAVSLTQASQLLQSKKYALVLVDQDLPDGQGIDFVTENASVLPCIMVTGSGSEKLAVESLKRGAKDYIVKDINGFYIELLPQLAKRAIREYQLEQENQVNTAAVEAINKRLRALFDSAPDLMIICNQKLIVQDISCRASKEYDIAVEALMGQPIANLMITTDYQKLQQQQENQLLQITMLPQNIPFAVSCRCIPGNDVLFTFRSQLEQQKTQYALAQLAQSEKNNLALVSANEQLRQSLKEKHRIIGQSAAVTELKSLIKNVATTDATVLIEGETGTGKELIAHNIHNLSLRHQAPIITLNCASMPKELVESELFGHEKGAFTSAHKKRQGKFRLAHGGTLFLDEIGELDLEVQSKLLRAIQEGEIQPVGAEECYTVDVRLIAATNQNLLTMVKAGTFRKDLYYRLNVIPIEVPSLTARKDDIPLLATAFLQKFKRLYNRHAVDLSSKQMQQLCDYHWPGNIRELQNVVEKFTILGSIDLLSNTPENTVDNKVENAVKSAVDSAAAHVLATEQTPQNALAIASNIASTQNAPDTLEAVERAHISQILDNCDWKVGGPNGAAQVLDLNPSTLRFRIKKLNISKEQ